MESIEIERLFNIFFLFTTSNWNASSAAFRTMSWKVKRNENASQLFPAVLFDFEWHRQSMTQWVAKIKFVKSQISFRSIDVLSYACLGWSHRTASPNVGLIHSASSQFNRPIQTRTQHNTTQNDFEITPCAKCLFKMHFLLYQHRMHSKMIQQKFGIFFRIQWWVQCRAVNSFIIFLFQ